MSTTTDTQDDQLRQQAIERLQKRSEFWAHLAAFLLVNALIITVWAMLASGGFFGPILPLFGWGIGLFFHAVDDIRREMERLS